MPGKARVCGSAPAPGATGRADGEALAVARGVTLAVGGADFAEGDPVPAKKFDFEPERGPRPQDGYFGLQNHSKDDVVFFKEVAVKMLKK